MDSQICSTGGNYDGWFNSQSLLAANRYFAFLNLKIRILGSTNF